MLSILAWALVFLVVVTAGHRLYRSIRGLRFLTSDASRFERSTLGAEHTRGEGHLLVLLPCLNEQTNVPHTLEHFSRLAREVPGRVKLLPITGESEDELKRVRREGVPELAEAWWRGLTRPTFLKLNGGRFPLAAFEEILRLRTFAKDATAFRDELLRTYDAYPSTATLIDKWLAEHPEEALFIERLHEPARRGTKATKLNFATSLLEGRYPELFTDDAPTYFAIYDFDARPHPRSFEYLVEKIRELRESGAALPTAFQQIPLPLGSELEQLPSTSPSLVAAAWRVEGALATDAFSVYAGRPRTSSLEMPAVDVGGGAGATMGAPGHAGGLAAAGADAGLDDSTGDVTGARSMPASGRVDAPPPSMAEATLGASPKSGLRRHRRRFRLPRSCRGSGLFVRALELKELGGFPVDSDDIALGYRLDFLGRRRLPHPYPVWVQPTPSTPQLVGQTRRVFHGIFSGRRELEWARRHSPTELVPGARKRLLLRYAQEFLPIVQLGLGLLAATLLAVGGRWMEAGIVLVGLWLLQALLLWSQVRLGTRLVERFERRAPRRWRLTTALVGAPLGPLFTLVMLAGYGMWKWRSGGQLTEETAST